MRFLCVGSVLQLSAFLRDSISTSSLPRYPCEFLHVSAVSLNFVATRVPGRFYPGTRVPGYRLWPLHRSGSLVATLPVPGGRNPVFLDRRWGKPVFFVVRFRLANVGYPGT
eukprot:3288480-Rhodomonas_salina.1